jgi:hypothetical protein
MVEFKLDQLRDKDDELKILRCCPLFNKNTNIMTEERIR